MKQVLFGILNFDEDKDKFVQVKKNNFPTWETKNFPMEDEATKENILKKFHELYFQHGENRIFGNINDLETDITNFQGVRMSEKETLANYTQRTFVKSRVVRLYLTTKRKQISNSDEERDEHQETSSTHERGQCEGSDTDVGVEERVLQLLREKEELLKLNTEMKTKLQIEKETSESLRKKLEKNIKTEVAAEENLRNTPTDKEAVTIYVKKDEESVYNAVMLKQFTIEELVNEISNAYSIEPKTIKNVYKRTKRGIMVNLDNRMLKLFKDEDDLTIEMTIDTLILIY